MDAGLGVASTTNTSNNVFVGFEAGKGITTGGNNTMLGYRAGDSVTTGANNIVLGYTADLPSATTSNHLNIGNIIYGDLSTGDVALGSLTPSYLLSLGGNAARTIGMERHTTTDTAGNSLTLQAGGATTGATNKNGGDLILSSGIATGTGDSNIAVRAYQNGTQTTLLSIDGDTGYVGIGTATPLYPLHVVGLIRSTSMIQAGGGTTMYTDRITPVSNFSGGILLNNDIVSIRTQDAGGYISFNPLQTEAMRIIDGGNVGVGTTAPQSALHVSDGKYIQAEDNNAGAPPSSDCDADAERGRLSLDTTNNRMYVCNGATRGWDYWALTN